MATPQLAPQPRDRVGDDGLTDAERDAFADRYQRGPAAKPDRAELAEIRELLATRK